MDTGENRLNAEMMKKLYESYKLHQKEDYEKIVEDCRKIISDKEYPDAGDILELVEGDVITDDHNRRLVDPSIFKIHGETLNVWDESYPVMFPEDEKMMRGLSDEIKEKFQEYVESNTGIPRSTLVIDSIPENVREKAEREALLYGDCYIAYYPARDFVTLTGAAKNFKVQQTCDKLEALYDILDTEAPDRNGRIWKREFMKKILNNRVFLTTPRGQKSWLWLKFLELQKSYEVKLQKTLGTPLSTKFELKSVIHMRWPKPSMSNLKARDFRYGKMWQDQELINYATGDVSHIDSIILDTLATFGPDINSGYDMSTPNLNDIDKKKLERVIKRRKKK